MKRMISLAMAILSVIALAVPAFAIAVKSPTQGGVPDIQLASPYFLDENGDPVGEPGCEVILDITPYQDKDDVGIAGTVIQESLETAYDSYKDDFHADARAMLSAADPGGNWNSKYPGWELRVVNIFDITLRCKQDAHDYGDYEGLVEYHGDHWIKLQLTDADASNFVALMHYYDADHNYSTPDAHWELIPTTQQGDEISFSLKCSNLSPFAIVVKTRDSGGGDDDDSGGGGGRGTHGGSGNEPTSPQTGEPDNSGYWLPCVIFLAAVGVKMIYCGKKEKRYAR